MCHNHSHLIAKFLGENTAGPVPVLTYALANRAVAIESPAKGGATMILPTSGLLYVPSWMLDGWSVTHGPQTVAPAMSLCFMPDDELTTILEILQRWPTSAETSLSE